jgi:peptide subunit release factor 1 (eRF1)
LIAHVLGDHRLGVLLVRRGGYGAGVFAGGKLLDSKVGSRHVQGTTKAGGWSQQRYARRRDNQAREAFAAATEVAVRILAPAKLDALVCGGDRRAIDTVLEDPRLKDLAGLVRPPFLGVPDPKQKVLEQAGAEARAIRIEVTQEEPS